MIFENDFEKIFMKQLAWDSDKVCVLFEFHNSCMYVYMKGSKVLCIR